jgi:hypothetical protein
MEIVTILAEFFLISIAFSYALFSPLANSQLTGNGFIKLISNLSLGALALALIINLSFGGKLLSVANVLKIISMISFLLISLFHKDQKSPFMWSLWGIIIFALLLDLILFSNATLMSFIFLLGASTFIGVITYAMTLGHWYLVVPKLSEKPLVYAALLTWTILAIKIPVSVYSYFQHTDFFTNGTELGSGYAFNVMLLLMRVLFGYIVIIGMSYFNWRLVKMRSIQSSTGVLYAMTFFVFIGELISCYMYFNYGLLI